MAPPTLCLLQAVPYLCILGAGLACSRSLNSNEATFDDIVSEPPECADAACTSSSDSDSILTSNAATSASKDAGASGVEVIDDANEAPNPTLPETTSAIPEELSDGASQEPPDAGPLETHNPTEPVASQPEANTTDPPLTPLEPGSPCGASNECASQICAAGLFGDVCCRSACGSNQLCAWNGACVCATTNEIVCEGECIDPTTDAEHCGARDDCSGVANGVQCSGQTTCVSGRCQGWHAAELLEHRGQESAYLPRAAVNGQGSAVAVWTRVHQVDTEEVHEVVSNQFDPQSRTWFAEAVKLSDDVGSASQPAVSMDAESNVVAVWSDNDNGYSRIAGKEQHAGVWSQPLELETVADVSLWPFVTHDAEGDCVAVWARWGDGDVAGNRRDPASGSWLPEAQLLEASGTRMVDVTAAILPGDTVLTVWAQVNGVSGHQIWADRFDPTHPNWTNARSIDNITDSALAPSVAFTSEQAWVVWEELNNGAVHANRLDLQTDTWLEEAFVFAPGTTTTFHAASPRIVSSPDGRLIVIWINSREGQSDVVGRHYDPLSLSWSSDVVIASDTGWSTDVHEMSPPKLAVDAQGNALVVWIHDTGNDVELRARHYDGVSQSWLPPVTLMSGGESMEADLAMDASGSALVVWVQVDDNGVDRSVWAARSAP